MLPSPVHLKLYLEITDLEWDSFDFRADGGKTTHRGLPWRKRVPWNRKTTLFLLQILSILISFSPEHLEKIQLSDPNYWKNPQFR